MHNATDLVADARAQGHEPLLDGSHGMYQVSCSRCQCAHGLFLGWLHLPCTGVPWWEWTAEMRAAQDARLDAEQERRNGEYVRQHPQAFDAATRWRYGVPEPTKEEEQP